MSAEDMIHEIIDGMDGATAEAIKRDPESLCLWTDLGNDFIGTSKRLIALGADEDEQGRLITLQEQLQKL